MGSGRLTQLSLSLSQLNHPELVEGLVLINIDPCAKGWIDWAASKVSPSMTLIICLFSHPLENYLSVKLKGKMRCFILLSAVN